MFNISNANVDNIVKGCVSNLGIGKTGVQKSGIIAKNPTVSVEKSSQNYFSRLMTLSLELAKLMLLNYP